MTFVAQPYERFADDLLTALTGGVAREEHRYVGAEATYTLVAPGSGVTDVRVYGQRNDRFTVFGAGVDYRYDAGLHSIAWLATGNPPDDRSHFYVTYEPTEANRRLTDRNPGSVNSVVSGAFARQFAVLNKQMEMIYESAFVDLATARSLDHVAALLGITRRDARFASGEILLTRTSPAPGDISIPTGTLVYTDRGQNFETTDRRTLRRGQLSVSAPVRAQAEGPAGQVEAGAIRNMNRPIFGVEGAVNEAATFFAAEKETDEELRRRIKAELERAGKSTVDAIRYGLIEDLPEIRENNVQVIERPEVPGSVEVRLGLGVRDDPDLVRRVEESIFSARAAGIRVTHNLPTRTPSDSAERAAAAERVLPRGANPPVHLTADVVQQEPEGIIELRVHVLLRLVERNLAASRKEQVEDDVRGAVVGVIAAIPMGADLIYSKLLGAVVAFEGVSDAVVAVGTRHSPDYVSNLAADGRKLIPGDVTVGLMDEPVRITIKVILRPASDRLATAPPPLNELRAACADAVNRRLAERRPALTRAALTDLLRTTLTTADAGVHLADGNAVALRAEYEETGRLLIDPDEIALDDHHVPELADLTLELPGVLDG